MPRWAEMTYSCFKMTSSLLKKSKTNKVDEGELMSSAVLFFGFFCECIKHELYVSPQWENPLSNCKIQEHSNFGDNCAFANCSLMIHPSHHNLQAVKDFKSHWITVIVVQLSAAAGRNWILRDWRLEKKHHRHMSVTAYFPFTLLEDIWDHMHQNALQFLWVLSFNFCHC